jgi:DNA repair ATPase RecN
MARVSRMSELGPKMSKASFTSFMGSMSVAVDFSASATSPFCILDEVDAALDEANIGRFVAVLREFLSFTQFIVISHSKKTMAGADTLYGVTMEESGVSKRVSVRFEDVSEDGHISPAALVSSESASSAAEKSSDQSDVPTRRAA